MPTCLEYFTTVKISFGRSNGCCWLRLKRNQRVSHIQNAQNILYNILLSVVLRNSAERNKLRLKVVSSVSYGHSWSDTEWIASNWSKVKTEQFCEFIMADGHSKIFRAYIFIPRQINGYTRVPRDANNNFCEIYANMELVAAAMAMLCWCGRAATGKWNLKNSMLVRLVVCHPHRVGIRKFSRHLRKGQLN